MPNRITTANGVAKVLIARNENTYTNGVTLRDPSEHEDKRAWFQGWMHAFHDTTRASEYQWLVKPIWDKFRFRCMQDAMEEIKTWRPEPCPIKGALRLTNNFLSRQDSRQTTCPNPPPSMAPEEVTLNEKAMTTEVIKDVRKETLDCLIVEFLTALTKMPALTRWEKKDVVEYIGWELWLETKGSEGRGEKFASGTWTSILCALLVHKHLQFKFTEFHCEATKGLRAFVCITLGAVVRMDSVSMLKKWLRRHNEDFSVVIGEDFYSYRKLALDMSMRFAAIECYKYFCCQGEPAWLKAISYKRAGAATITEPGHAMNMYPEATPPLQPAMLTLMWNACGLKPALPKPPSSERGLRKQWVKHYLWERLRRGVRARGIFVYLMKLAAEKAGYACFEEQEDGEEGPQRSLLVGSMAAECFDEQATMNDAESLPNRQHTGGDNTCLAFVEAKVAAARARIAERERKMREARDMTSDSDDADDSDDAEPPDASGDESDEPAAKVARVK